MPARGYTIMVHRDGALDSRQLHVKGWLARTVLIAGSTFVILLIVAAVLYGPTTVAALRTPFLEREIARLRTENTRVTELAQRLDEVEARYAHLRGMLGGNVGMPDVPPAAAGRAREERLYVAPPAVARAPQPVDTVTADTVSDVGPSIPHRWPLSVRSYRTRGLAVGDSGTERHTGLDLAVPVGSDVRASGGGTVKETATDSSYGLYVLLQHPDGYETMYGHLSRVVVAQGDSVRTGQVIGLSGNSGRSTAPHLHFEIRRGGQSVNPLSLVREGN